MTKSNSNKPASDDTETLQHCQKNPRSPGPAPDHSPAELAQVLPNVISSPPQNPRSPGPAELAQVLPNIIPPQIPRSPGPAPDHSPAELAQVLPNVIPSPPQIPRSPGPAPDHSPAELAQVLPNVIPSPPQIPRSPGPAPDHSPAELAQVLPNTIPSPPQIPCQVTEAEEDRSNATRGYGNLYMAVRLTLAKICQHVATYLTWVWTLVMGVLLYLGRFAMLIARLIPFTKIFGMMVAGLFIILGSYVVIVAMVQTEFPFASNSTRVVGKTLTPKICAAPIVPLVDPYYGAICDTPLHIPVSSDIISAHQVTDIAASIIIDEEFWDNIAEYSLYFDWASTQLRSSRDAYLKLDHEVYRASLKRGASRPTLMTLNKPITQVIRLLTDQAADLGRYNIKVSIDLGFTAGLLKETRRALQNERPPQETLSTSTLVRTYIQQADLATSNIGSLISLLDEMISLEKESQGAVEAVRKAFGFAFMDMEREQESQQTFADTAYDSLWFFSRWFTGRTIIPKPSVLSVLGQGIATSSDTEQHLFRLKDILINKLDEWHAFHKVLSTSPMISDETSLEQHLKQLDDMYNFSIRRVKEINKNIQVAKEKMKMKKTGVEDSTLMISV